MAVENNLGTMINVYKKLYLIVFKWNKKHSWKKVIPITYTLEKIFFAVATFGGL